MRQVAQPVQARLQAAGEVQSYHREGKEECWQLNRGDHWEGTVAHLDDIPMRSDSEMERSRTYHQERSLGEAWSLEGMEEDRQGADP